MQYSASRKARILIVDDHPIVRQGMSMLINREPELLVCCEASDIAQAIIASRACQHDLAIVDMSLGGASGLDLVKKLRADFPHMFVLMMSMHDEAVYAEPALQAGAQGYLMKQAATSTMLKAIRHILAGESYLSEQMNARLGQRARKSQGDASLISCLTASEFEVLHLIGLGLGTSEISNKLNRSIKTIESHRANIRKKLNLKNGNELARFAISFVSSTARQI
ncbi:MAG: response regulator transcription factor [Nitrosomonadales bacterium]|nr:response regulator transcription factor [Nitrosomonadales bacterium]